MGFREALSQREGGLGRDNNIQCVDITSTYSSWPQGADTATDGDGTGAQRRHWPKVSAGIMIGFGLITRTSALGLYWPERKRVGRALKRQPGGGLKE